MCKKGSGGGDGDRLRPNPISTPSPFPFPPSKQGGGVRDRNGIGPKHFKRRDRLACIHLCYSTLCFKKDACHLGWNKPRNTKHLYTCIHHIPIPYPPEQTGGATKALHPSPKGHPTMQQTTHKKRIGKKEMWWTERNGRIPAALRMGDPGERGRRARNATSPWNACHRRLSTFWATVILK